jgi:hypothetical protein
VSIPEGFTARIERLDQLSLQLYREANVWRTRLSPITRADCDAYRKAMMEAAQQIRFAAETHLTG